MGVRNLGSLFKPQSIAVIGASNRESSAGFRYMHNLLAGGFSGPIMPVNPKHTAVTGVLAYKDVASLPVVPELSILCIPDSAVVTEAERLAARGCKAAIVFSADFAQRRTAEPLHLRERFAEIRAKYGMRVLGPSSLGVMVPGNNLNASPLFAPPLPGRVAFVTQSVSLASAVVDWSRTHGIGFSHLISLGEAADVDFGDLLDYLGSDPTTRAILLYIESIRQRRNFMSAARAAARNKPVLAIKSGRSNLAAQAAMTHTGALAGADHVYDAAFSRAGMLRVYELEEMFAAAETLGRIAPPRDSSLAILTNGGGIAVVAADELSQQDGTLAELSKDTIAKLDEQIVYGWSRSNPVDIHSYAPLENYRVAMEALLTCPEISTLLVMHAPTSLSPPQELADEIIRSATQHRGKSVMTCFVGGERMEPARKQLRDAGLPSYETPHGAIRAFSHLIRYRRNQEMLMETPSEAPTPSNAAQNARAAVDAAMKAGLKLLDENTAREVLGAYGIPFVESGFAANPAAAGRLADKFGGMVALKLVSPDIVHKSDYHGVALDLSGAFEVERAAHRMIEQLARTNPNFTVAGFTVQRMADRPFAQELIVGVSTDPIFGPVIMFGQGGTAVDVVGDFSIGLPPLNTNLAGAMINQTRVKKLLDGYRDHPRANIEAICTTLVMVSQLVVDIPEIRELDINPFFADAEGVLAVDCRIRVAECKDGQGRLAIRPYPQRLEEIVKLRTGRKVLLRPIRPEDEPNHHRFVASLTEEDLRFRFFGQIHSLPHSEMARLTQIDYDRDMAFIAVTIDTDEPETIGVVRAMSALDNETAEFAVVVRPDQKGNGLARALMQKMIAYSRGRGTGALVGQVLTDNRRMIAFVESLGFRRTKLVDHDIVEMVLDLKSA
jgi:acetyltransferase